MSEIVITVAVQSVFRLEMHQNKKNFIFKKLFLISAHQNNLKTKKKFKIFKPNTPLIVGNALINMKQNHGWSSSSR
jgi:hypothetical protein